MPIVLELLDDVRWHGRPVVGDRPRALLATLAAGDGRAVSSDRLVEAVWGEDAPANAGKALQVLVSRTRSACGPDAVVRDDIGYRLGVPPEQVDALRLTELTRGAGRALAAGDPARARALVTEARTLTRSLVAPGDEDGGALARLRRDAAAADDQLAALLGRALTATGDHADALPLLEEAVRRDGGDEATLACLLRSEAAVRGAGAALDRYERYRTDLRDRLGVDPGPELQRAHRDLLARDNPVREGLRYDATPLIGRDDDVRALRALVDTSRVVSVVGPGGLGKTRLAHVLGHDAEQPVVHFVELVGVTSPEDLIGEVGSALGVRDSLSGRRALTPEQRSDVRARIARHLASAPSLLILDNCEHLVDAVADLVAFLVATTRDLRVVTTSRAPLAIAAERVYLLGELAAADAGRLFRQRAVAARPTVSLDDDAVAGIVARLDGLPLAIELAAAKVRVMSVEEIRTRLADRFALLRGGVRNAPDRHRTLLAVIDWSWHLLDEPERRALRRLSVLHDGFTLDTAEAMLGPEALTAVQALVDQSLLTVAESGAAVRYRMLETVREFGRMHLVDAGEEEQALLARRAWATHYAGTAADRLFGPDQFEAMDTLAAEESNLADTLRYALGASDPAAVVQLLAGLGALWSIRGDHMRVVTLTGAVADVVSDWDPPAELRDVTRVAACLMLHNAMIADDRGLDPVRELLTRLGTSESVDPRVNAMITVLLAYDAADPKKFRVRLDELGRDPDRHIAQAALQWRSHALENSGDLTGAVDAAERALPLTRDDDGPWSAAILHTLLCELHTQLGHRDPAVTHAQAAIPVLDRLGAVDDLVEVRSSLVLAAVAQGRLDDATAEFDRMSRLVNEADAMFGVTVPLQMAVAEIALARGDHATGIAAYRESVAHVRTLTFPVASSTGLEPWLLFGEATALNAFAHYGRDDEQTEAAELFRACRDRALGALDGTRHYLDYPATGTVLFALGAWSLLRGSAPAADAVRLLVLADGFAYNRTVPSMAWELIEPDAERLAPGRIAALRAEYGDRRGPDLLADARATVERIG